MNPLRHLVFLVLVFLVIRSAPKRPETSVWQSQAVAIITFGYIATLAVGQRRRPRRSGCQVPSYEAQQRAMETTKHRDNDPLGWLARRPWNGGDL